MKRTFAFLLTLVLLISCAGCQQPDILALIKPTSPPIIETATEPEIPETETTLPVESTPATEPTTQPSGKTMVRVLTSTGISPLDGK